MLASCSTSLFEKARERPKLEKLISCVVSGERAQCECSNGEASWVLRIELCDGYIAHPPDHYARILNSCLE